MEIDCYTDASYAKDTHGSVIGYKIGDREIVIEFLDNIKNSEAEMIAIQRCIDQSLILYPGNIINIYSDCQKAEKINILNVRIHKLIGHMKSSLRDEKQQIF